ncbi:unnamed protein product, partial [marine sediment metagenome]
PKIKGKILEAWVTQSIGKRPRWQDTFMRLGMKYWGINGVLPPILLDYQVHWHTPNPELKLLLQQIDAKHGKRETEEIYTTGVIDIADMYEYRKRLWTWICDIKGLRVLAPFLVVIVGKEIDFTIALNRKAGLLKEPAKVCFTDADVTIPGTKTYWYHGVKYTCPDEIDPKAAKCFPIEKDKGPSGIHEFKIYSGGEPGVKDARPLWITTSKFLSTGLKNTLNTISASFSSKSGFITVFLKHIADL